MAGLGRRKLTVGRTDEQLLLMRVAGLLVARTLEVVCAAVEDGVTTLELDRLAETHIRDHGGIPNFQLVPGYSHTLCTSVNDEVVHGIPSAARVLRTGDLVSIDCGAQVGEWNGDAARSLVVGGDEAARPEDLAVIATTRESMWAGALAMVAGERLYDVGAAVEASIEAAAERDGRPYGIVEDYVGHGIGRSMHEDPNIPNFAVAAKGPILRSGFTGAIEPMVTLGSEQTKVLGDDWTVVTTDGSRAAHWENTVAVTDAGLWVLTEVDGGRAIIEAGGRRFAPLGD